jgi:hypothetical protein
MPARASTILGETARPEVECGVTLLAPASGRGRASARAAERRAERGATPDRTDPTGMTWDQGEDGYLAVGMFTGIVGLGVAGKVAGSGGGSAPGVGSVAGPATAGLDIYRNYLDNKAFTRPTYQGDGPYSTQTSSAQQARSAPGSLGAGADWAPGGTGGIAARAPARPGSARGSDWPGPNLVPDPSGLTFRLSESARQALQPIFDRFGYDLRQTQIAFARLPDMVGASAVAFGEGINISAVIWNTLTPREQLGLLSHEFTHSVQYRELGIIDFTIRYIDEYPQYGVPSDLNNILIEDLDPVDPNFALDEIADRVRVEFFRGSPGP